MLTLIILLSAANQLTISFSNNCPQLEVKGEALYFLPPLIGWSQNATEFVRFVQYFLDMGERREKFLLMFPNASALKQECWEKWIELVNRGNAVALCDLISAINSGKHKLKADSDLKEKLYNAQKKLRIEKTSQTSVSSRRQFSYTFDQITDAGLAYLESFLRLEKAPSSSSIFNFWKNKKKVEEKTKIYKYSAQEIALDWLKSMPIPVQDAIVGQFKSLEAYYPILSCPDNGVSLTSSCNIVTVDEEKTRAEKDNGDWSSSSVEEVDALLEKENRANQKIASQEKGCLRHRKKSYKSQDD